MKLSQAKSLAKGETCPSALTTASPPNPEISPVETQTVAERIPEAAGEPQLAHAEIKARRKFEQADLRVVVFTLAGSEYVVPVSDVQEIILLNELIHLPNAPECVEGLVKRRGRIVTVIDLRKRLGFPHNARNVDTCVLIARLSFGPVGFIVDSTSELRWIKTQDFETPSQALAGIDQLFLRGISYTNGRLLIMLDFEKLLSPTEQDQLERFGISAARADLVDTLYAHQAADLTKESRLQTRADFLNLLTFELSGELYGAPMTSVYEVRELLSWIPLPIGRVAPHVLGLVNLRGVVLPVVDLRRRFGLPIKPNSNENRLVILRGEGALVALWADAVCGLMRLNRSMFQPAPSGVARIDTEFYDQVASVDGRMLIELNIPKLLNDMTSKS